MKKNLSILLAAVLATSSLVVPAMADNDITQGEDTVASASAVAVSYASDDIKIVVNGNNIECDQAPVIIENRTLVPLRAISEAIGAKVDWNNQDKTINITSDDLELNLTVGSKEVTATNKTDTQTLTIDVPAQIINDRTMVPVRFIAEAFGTVVDWDQESKTVSISEKVEDTTQSTEETTVSDESTESTTVEQTSETTTQEVKVISSKDRDLSLKNKQDNVITDEIVEDDNTLLSINATYPDVENNSAYTEFLKNYIENDVKKIKKSNKDTVEREYNKLDDSKKSSFTPTIIKYTAEVTYADDKVVSTLITVNYFRNTLMYNSERTIMVTDPTGENSLSIEELTDDNVTTDQMYDYAKEKFNKLFEEDKVHYYLDKVKNGGLENSMLKFYIDSNKNFVFTADRGIVAPSNEGPVSVVITPSEVEKLYK